MSEQDDNWYGEEAATLGDRLAAAREAAGLTAKQLAKKLGVKRETVEMWENDLKEPRANRLQMLTGLLGVSLRWLLTGVGEGLDSPDSSETVPQDVGELLAEMRALRAQMARNAVRLGELEKRLRKAVSAI